MKNGFRWCMAILACSLSLSFAARAGESDLAFSAPLAERVCEVKSTLSFPNMPGQWKPCTSEASGVIVIVSSLNPHPGLWMEILHSDFQLNFATQSEARELQGLCYVVSDPPAVNANGPWYLGFNELFIMSTGSTISLQLLFEVPLDVDAVNLTFRGRTIVKNLPIKETLGAH